jgi:hypothetical protein
MSLCIGIAVHYTYCLQYELVSVSISFSLYGYSSCVAWASKPNTYKLLASILHKSDQ